MLFQDQEVIEIHNGPSRILISARHGARLLLWEYEGRQVIYWPETANWSLPSKIRGGNPVLFPFIARHFVDGTMNKWKAKDGTVYDMPMHGFARDSEFRAQVDQDTCILTLNDSESTRAVYPYRFQFCVDYSLGEKTLDVTFRTRNLSEESMPYYAGHHFYFALPHVERKDWDLAIDSVKTGRQSPDGSAIDGPSLSSPLNVADQNLVDTFHLLSGAGPVFLRNKQNGRSLAIHLNFPSSEPWYAVTTWTEKTDSDFYCIEPWLGLPNAIHHGQGLQHIPPGESQSAHCRIELMQW